MNAEFSRFFYIYLSKHSMIRHLYSALEWRVNRFFEIPEEKKIHILPTLRCNLRCPYCTNYLGSEKSLVISKELSVDKWLNIIRKVNKNVVITGGEPMLFHGIEDLVAQIPTHLKVYFFTNLVQIKPAFLEKVHRKVSFYCSCHQSNVPVQTIKTNLEILAHHEGFSGSIHTIQTTTNADFIEQCKTVFADSPWPFSIHPDKLEISSKVLMKEKKHVLCRQHIFLVGPDGKQYPCSTKLFLQKDNLSDLNTESFVNSFQQVECDNWGSCASCDGQTEAETSFLE